MSAADVPMFISTEDAERYGRALALEQFPTLVRTWFVLREAIQAFLFPNSAIRNPHSEFSEVGGS